MKKLITTALSIFLIQWAWAQYTVNGKVVDAETGSFLAGAEVQLSSEDYQAVLSNEIGNFSFHNLPAGSYILGVRYQGYAYYYHNFKLKKDTTFLVELTTFSEDLGTLVIKADRIDYKVPTTVSTLDKGEITLADQGKDMPFILNSSPSTVINSDAGNGVGYTGIRIRGIDPTRVNVTINGIPLNDAESQGVFWVDLPDLASSTQEIQVQRGIGTSTNGAASFGASINLRTDNLLEYRNSFVTMGMGSFNTYRSTVGFGSGLIGNKFIVQGRFSYIQSAGFIDRASSELISAQIAAGYKLKKGNLKVNIMLGNEETYQAWYGIPQPKFNGDQSELQNYINYLGIAGNDLENLQNSDSNTYNFYTYWNEVDHYTQNHYQAFFDHKLGTKGVIKVALHATTGAGYYEQQKPGETLADYGLPPVVIGTDSNFVADLQRRLWLDNIFYGTVINYFLSTKTGDLNLGAAINRYDGLHFGEVISTEFTEYNTLNHRYYENDATKSEQNYYAKYLLHLKKLHPYVDLQYRMVNYRFQGLNRNGQVADQQVNYTFFNPKVGASYFLTRQLKLYGMYAAGNREPVREDFVSSTPESRPKPEHLKDLELGFEANSNNYLFGLTYFNMQYTDALVLNGAINDVGGYTRVNVPESFRKGFEFYAGFNLTSRLHFAGNYTSSSNKIVNYVEYVDDWDTWESVKVEYEGETSIALSPEKIAFLSLQVDVTRFLFLDLTWKYVGKQFLDNTQSEDRKLDPFSTWNMSLMFDKFRSGKLSRLNMGLYLNNLTNVAYAPTGYTFSGIIGGQRQSFNYVYPMAGFNLMFRVRLEFNKQPEDTGIRDIK